MVADLCTAAAYKAQRQHLFPSETSLAWYIRRNRAELVKAGALLIIGKRQYINPAPFDQVVVRIGMATAEAATA